MEFVVIIIIFFILFQLYNNWQNNRPENIINRLDLLISKREEGFDEDKKRALEKLMEIKEVYIDMNGKEKFKDKVNEYEEPDIERNKIRQLVVHLREKYKQDPTKIIQILGEYIDWLSAAGFYYDFRSAIEPSYLEDDLNENNIKAFTIKQKLIKLGDKEFVKLLSLSTKQ